MRLTDLPGELLFQIFSYLDNRSLASVSLTCKRLQIAQKPLFSSLNVICYQTQTENAVDFLLKTPHIRSHIQYVAVRHPTGNGSNEQEQEAHKVCRLLRFLPALRSVWLHGLCQYVTTILWSVSQRDEPVDLIIDGNLSATSIHHFEKAVSVSKSFSCGVCFDRRKDHVVDYCSSVLRSWPTSPLKALKLVSLRADESEVDRAQTFHMVNQLLFLSAPSLEELHVSWGWSFTRASLDTNQVYNFPIEWPRLQRLALLGKSMIAGLLPLLAPSLRGLKCLSVAADAQTDFDLVGSDRARRGLPSPFLQMPKLRELYVYGSSVTFEVQYFAQPSLEVLKIHHSELLSPAFRHCRSPEDLKLLALLSPNLKHLELDVGPIEHAFHPTAISGVDVSARLYRVFDAITSFPHLKHLRLFPPYQNNSDSADYYNMFQQPVSDESMIRIFSALRFKCPSLETLAVSSDESISYIAHEVFNFFAAKWEAKIHGTETILITSQAFKDYEERQVWAGQRKIRSEIRRFHWQRPVAPVSEEWILT